MSLESTAHLPISLAMFQEMIHAPSGTDLAHAFLRWTHFVGGITWIGLLYFFNLINVPFQKGLDADTKKKVNPDLLSRTLWYFRWGAIVTVLAGLIYYAQYILASDAKAAGVNVWSYLGIWLVIVLVAYAILYFLYNIPALTKDGRVLAVVIAILAIAMSAIIIYVLGNAGGKLATVPGTREQAATYLGNKSISIGIGGGLGIMMMLNVWGIIWPTQKRAISAMQNATPPPSAELMRKAFLASRTNAWLSLPLLFFMGTSHGDWILFGK